jgi:uncharacterized phiE125 gp8 family phage protein
VLASIRYLAGLGNAALYVRARDASGRFWDWTTPAWVAPETPACRVFLTEFPDAGIESLYEVGIDAPPGDVVIEYVRLSDFRVLGEDESIDGLTVATQPPALAQLADLKILFSKTDAADDPLLVRLLSAASEFVQRQTGRTFALVTYTEPHDWNGEHLLVPKNYPVTAVASVSIDGQTIDKATDETTPGWIQDGNVIRLRNVPLRDWLSVRRVANCTISYTAGYASIPQDIQQAVLELAALKFRERAHIGQASQTLQGSSVSFLPSIVPLSVQAVLDSYRSVSF